MPDLRVYIAVSLDGYIATPDGGVAWLDPYNPSESDYTNFIKEIGAIVMGRKTFDQVMGWGQWHYEGLPVIVQTRRPLPANRPAGVEAWDGPVEPLADRLRRESKGDIWLIGGAESIASFDAVGLIDRWQIHMIPVLLHSGIPMFPVTKQAPLSLRLTRAHANACGIVELDYRRATQ